jgi:hypothetical protein
MFENLSFSILFLFLPLFHFIFGELTLDFELWGGE